MIIAGDIGGTKTLLALYAEQEAQSAQQAVFKQSYPSRDFADFADILSAFIAQAKPVSPISAVCLGVAGPIHDGLCDATNLPWVLSEKHLSERFNGIPVKLLNDLESTAYGVLELPAQKLDPLNDNKVTSAHRAIIAAGTGLGEALLIYQDDSFIPVATEGGHADFAPCNTLQMELWQFLHQRYPEHVSYERLVSGMGLENIYDFFRQKHPDKATSDLDEKLEQGDKAAEISRAALDENHPLCCMALETFVHIYAQEAANLALKTLSRGGIYLAGGIASKILPAFSRYHFIEHFYAKGRFKSLMQTIPVMIVLEPESALLGAYAYARHYLSPV